MRLHHSIALAAVAAGIAVPAAAHARPRKPAPAAVEGQLTTAEQLQMAQQQLAQLQAQLNQLQARLDAIAPANAPAPAQAGAEAAQLAAEASAKADKALAAATAARTAQTTTDRKVGAMAWAADTRISGRMYFNLSSITADSALGANVEKRGGFQIKRFYVGIDHKFSDKLAANITVDVDNVIRTAALKTSSTPVLTPGGSTPALTGATLTTSNTGQGLYIKKAYLQAKLGKAFDVRLGSDDLPWIPYVEGIYGYRHVERTIADLDGFGTSADWGVHVRGELAGGLVNYQVSAVNGGGYRNPALTQTVDFEGRLALVYKGLNIAVGGYAGKLSNDQLGTTTLHSAHRFDALVAYKGTAGPVAYTVGAEYLYVKDWKNILTLAEDSSEGYSLFASVSPRPKWSVFGRYDWIKPGKDLNPDQHANYYNLGIQFEPAKIVDFALVYKHTDATAGLAIGDLLTGEQTRNEIGLYGQLRF